MKPTVYIETTIISYLTAWPSRDVVRLSHEILTRKWWDQRERFELYTSEIVRLEAAAGDPSAAAERLKAIEGMTVLPPSASALALAQRPAIDLCLPQRAQADAGHIALAAAHGISFLLTWNCRHLANAALTDRIQNACSEAGLLAPHIVTPEVMMGFP